MKAVLWRLLRVVGQYVIALAMGTWLVLVVSILAGYLPYAAPGWHPMTFPQKLEGIRFVSGFAALLVPFGLVLGFAIFLVGQLLKTVRTPRWGIRLVGSVVSALASGYALVGLGWYISIAEWPVYAGIGVGAAFGALSLPRALDGQQSVAAPPVA